MKRTRKMSILWLTIVIVAGLSTTALAEEWYKAYDKGVEAVKNGKYADAVRYLDDAISSHPEAKANTKTYGMNFIDYLPYVYRAAAHAGMGEFDEAEADIRQSQRYNELDGARRDKDASNILAGVMDALETNRLFVAANSQFDKKDYDKAITGFEAVLKRDPNHALAKERLAQAQEEKDKLTVAQQQQQTTPPPKQTTTQPRTTTPPPKQTTTQPQQTQTTPKPDPAAQQRAADERRISTLITEGKSLFDGGKVMDAREKFSEVQTIDSSNRESGTYIQRIDAIENKTRNGFRAFCAGNYDLSIRELAEASQSRSDKASVFGILACAYASKYYLTGEENDEFMKNARSAWAQARRLDANYAPDTRYVSPKIAVLLAGN